MTSAESGIAAATATTTTKTLFGCAADITLGRFSQFESRRFCRWVAAIGVKQDRTDGDAPGAAPEAPGANEQERVGKGLRGSSKALPSVAALERTKKSLILAIKKSRAPGFRHLGRRTAFLFRHTVKNQPQINSEIDFIRTVN